MCLAAVAHLLLLLLRPLLPGYWFCRVSEGAIHVVVGRPLGSTFVLPAKLMYLLLLLLLLLPRRLRVLSVRSLLVHLCFQQKCYCWHVSAARAC